MRAGEFEDSSEDEEVRARTADEGRRRVPRTPRPLEKPVRSGRVRVQDYPAVKWDPKRVDFFFEMFEDACRIEGVPEENRCWEAVFFFLDPDECMAVRAMDGYKSNDWEAFKAEIRRRWRAVQRKEVFNERSLPNYIRKVSAKGGGVKTMAEFLEFCYEFDRIVKGMVRADNGPSGQVKARAFMNGLHLKVRTAVREAFSRDRRLIIRDGQVTLPRLEEVIEYTEQVLLHEEAHEIEEEYRIGEYDGCPQRPGKETDVDGDVEMEEAGPMRRRTDMSEGEWRKAFSEMQKELAELKTMKVSQARPSDGGERRNYPDRGYGRPMGRMEGPSGGYSGGFRGCYYCGRDTHRKRDCAEYQDLLDRGILRNAGMDSVRMAKDGTLITHGAGTGTVAERVRKRMEEANVEKPRGKEPDKQASKERGSGPPESRCAILGDGTGWTPPSVNSVVDDQAASDGEENVGSYMERMDVDPRPKVAQPYQPRPKAGGFRPSTSPRTSMSFGPADLARKTMATPGTVALNIREAVNLVPGYAKELVQILNDTSRSKGLPGVTSEPRRTTGEKKPEVHFANFEHSVGSGMEFETGLVGGRVISCPLGFTKFTINGISKMALVDSGSMINIFPAEEVDNFGVSWTRGNLAVTGHGGHQTGVLGAIESGTVVEVGGVSGETTFFVSQSSLFILGRPFLWRFQAQLSYRRDGAERLLLLDDSGRAHELSLCGKKSGRWPTTVAECEAWYMKPRGPKTERRRRNEEGSEEEEGGHRAQAIAVSGVEGDFSNSTPKSSSSSDRFY